MIYKDVSNFNKNYYNKKYFLNRNHLQLNIAFLLKTLLKRLNLVDILEVGSGTGRLTDFFKKNSFKVIGCDKSEEAVKISGHVKADATNLPFENNSFDCILAISLIEHLSIKEIKKFLNESQRLLRGNGYIFIVTPNFMSPNRFMKGKKWFAFRDPTHLNLFTPFSLNRLLKENSFYKVRFFIRFLINFHLSGNYQRYLVNFQIL